MEVMRENFRPEFLNRVDETIIFHGLKKSELRNIIQIQVKRLEARLTEQKIGLKLSEAAVDFLADIGYDPVYGARPLKRAIQRYLETAIAKALLRSEYQAGDTILVGVESERLSFKPLSKELITV
jgi:ATP-dependent Clp protease ATP-binding subunit ClpB